MDKIRVTVSHESSVPSWFLLYFQFLLKNPFYKKVSWNMGDKRNLEM